MCTFIIGFSFEKSESATPEVLVWNFGLAMLRNVKVKKEGSSKEPVNWWNECAPVKC